MSRSPATNANQTAGDKAGQKQGGQQGGGRGGQSQDRSSDQQGDADDGHDAEDDADADGDGDESDDGDESGEDDSSKNALKTLEARLRKSEKERRRLKKRLKEASSSQPGQQQQQQQGGQQQNGGTDQSQTEVAKLKQALSEREARDQFLDVVLDDSDGNRFRVKTRKQAMRAWKAIKDDAEIDDDGEIENLDTLLKDLRSDMPEIFQAKKNGKKSDKVNTSGDGGSGSRGRMTPTQNMNAGIRDMFKRKQGHS